MLRKRYQLLILAVIILAAYYPAVLADASLIDDSGMIRDMGGARVHDLVARFLPGAAGGLYYRPVIVTSYLFDKYVLGLMPGMMHLENILLHFLNACLVYFLTLRLLEGEKVSPSYFPLLAACLFGLHPINTESVNWLSGRTDILAGTFVLSSALLLLDFIKSRSKRYLLLSMIAFFAGVLTKESALAFAPGLLLIFFASDRGHSLSQSKDLTRRMILLAGPAVVVFFFLLRSVAFTSNSNLIGKSIEVITNDWVHSLFTVLGAFGFYLKKLVLPLPLNFSIVVIDPLYEILGVVFAGISLYLLLRRSMSSSFFSAGIFLIMPAFLIAFRHIAWTSHAERYLYMPSAFIIISAVLFAAPRSALIRASFVRPTLAVLLIVMFGTTHARSITWQSDFSLCRDTVQESPYARDIRFPYVKLLADRGEYAEARKQLNEAKSIPYFGYDRRVDIYEAYLAYKQENLNEAIVLLEKAIEKSKEIEPDTIRFYIFMLEQKKNIVKTQVQKKSINRAIFASTERLYSMTGEPQLLFDLGVSAKSVGERRKALFFFIQAVDKLASDDPYRRLAFVQIQDLKRTRDGDLKSF